MVQATSYMNSKKRKKGPNKGVLLVVALIIIFVGAVAWFRSGGNDVTDQVSETTSSHPEINTVASDNPKPTMLAGIVDSVELSDVSGGSGTGEAMREIEDGFYRHVVKAYLPEPNENQFYEGWLVRPSPFDYFSTGSMVHNESGEWVLEWFGEFGQDYSDYMRVVITLELDDGNSDPADHVLEGEF